MLQNHYYQPMWTLVGGGLKNFEQSRRPMASVLPSQCKWIKDAAETFDPENNTITLASGNKVSVQTAVLLVVFCIRE